MAQKLTTEERIKLREEILSQFKKYNIKYIMRKCTRLKILNNNIELSEKYNLYVQQFRSEEEALYCLDRQDDYSNHLCPVCNKNVCSFYYNKKHIKYNKTCDNNECYKKMIRTPEIQRKCEKTNLKKYGVKSTFQTKNVRQKSEQTILKKYGVKNVMQCEEVKEKAQNTNLIRYGCKCSAQNEEVKRKAKNSYIKTITNKRKNNIKHNDVINFINRFNKIYHQNIQLYELYYNDEYFIKLIKHLYKIKKRFLKLIEIADIFKFHPSTISKRLKKLKLIKYFNIFDSKLEIQFENFLICNNLIQCEYNKINNNGDYVRKEKSILPKTDKLGSPEIDFYLKDRKIGFEINDIESHNIKQKDRFYHHNKTIECVKKGIQLIHIWEWDLTDEVLWSKTSQWILNLLNTSKIEINGEDCHIKKIDQNEERQFLNRYSLYNYTQSQTCIGLYHDNELIQLMSFNQLENNNHELLRFCTKYGNDIKNGAKVLLNYFIQSYNINSIIAYQNIDKFTGKTFEDLGFILLRHNEPELIMFNNDCNSPHKSMYDCGQNIFILKCK